LPGGRPMYHHDMQAAESVRFRERVFSRWRHLRCGSIGVFLALVSNGLAIPIIVTYLEEGLVPRLPTAVLSTGLMIVAVLSVSSGLVLDAVTRGRCEMKPRAYLSEPPVVKT
jgi:hypothetical protein